MVKKVDKPVDMYDIADQYTNMVCDRLMQYAPVTAAIAMIIVTIGKIAGSLENTVTDVVFFDIICLGYFGVAHYFRAKGRKSGGVFDKKTVREIEISVVVLALLQWNLIAYMFPAGDSWVFFGLYASLLTFFFNRKVVLSIEIGVFASIVVSWILLPDIMLPERNEMFPVYMGLRVAAIVLTFFTIFYYTSIGEKFKTNVEKNSRELERQNRELAEFNNGIISYMAELVEWRDGATGSHVKRMEKYVSEMAMAIKDEYPEYGLDDNDVFLIAKASAMHDIGKINISDTILLKPGKLTAEEFETMKQHTVIGAKLTEKLPKEMGEKFINYCHQVCLYHHERYDGKGYPEKLKGEDIPIAAQIVGICDCYDALTNERVYKKAIPAKQACDMINQGECGTFSYKILSVFNECTKEVLEGEV